MYVTLLNKYTIYIVYLDYKKKTVFTVNNRGLKLFQYVRINYFFLR